MGVEAVLSLAVLFKFKDGQNHTPPGKEGLEEHVSAVLSLQEGDV